MTRIFFCCSCPCFSLYMLLLLLCVWCCCWHIRSPALLSDLEKSCRRLQLVTIIMSTSQAGDESPHTQVAHSVSSLPLPPSLLSALHAGGFIDTQDLVDSTPLELSRELNIPMDKALIILTAAKATPPISGSSGTELIKALPSAARLTASATSIANSHTASLSTVNSPMNLPIITFCRGVDSLLGGGVQCGQVTELCGVPGIGKHLIAQCSTDFAKRYDVITWLNISMSVIGCGWVISWITCPSAPSPVSVSVTCLLLPAGCVSRLL